MTIQQRDALMQRMRDLALVALSDVPENPRIMFEENGDSWRVMLWRSNKSRGPALLELRGHA